MIGIFGGTFNPIHFGHLRSAVELIDALQLQQMRLVPCGLPPHREVPTVNALQRLAMVKAAVSSEPKLIVDEREIHREGPSFTIDTLRSLRSEFPQVPLALMAGSDSFNSFDTWHEWEAISDYAHIVVMQRPKSDSGENAVMSDKLQVFMQQRLTGDVALLHKKPAGCIYRHVVTQLAISATHIRDLIKAGHNARYLLPESVWEVICDNGYYQ